MSLFLLYSKFFRAHHFRITIFLYLFSISAFSSAETVAKSDVPATDVRLLIDISGSMKKNDPSNLRIPAVNLLTELLPDGNKAGVWTFGQWVNNLIKYQRVDDTWRAMAKEKAKAINSVALFTNIGAVLEKSSDDFYKASDFSNTHFILLTDGMVDIDKNSAKNIVERERVLGEVLQRFEEQGAKIHTVALSKHADTSLMNKLAIRTGGQSGIAETPEELSRIFLQAFDQAVPSEQVPFEGNEFLIDSSIEEFTALIFRESGAKPTRLIGPDEAVYTADQVGDDISWYQDAGYDLITVTRPIEGSWLVDAQIQPDSRVTVVSNLQMDVTRLPSNFFAGEKLKLEVKFLEDDELLTSEDFLNLLDVNIKITREDGKSGMKALNDPVQGVFSESITKLKNVGAYEVDVLVDGKTFKRKFQQIINLRSPFDFEMFAGVDLQPAAYQLNVLPLAPHIDPVNTTIFAKLKSPDGSNLIKALELDPKTNSWSLPILAEKGDGTYTVEVKVKGIDIEGNEFRFSPAPFDAIFPIPLSAANSIVSIDAPKPDEAEDEPMLNRPEPEVVIAEPEIETAEPVSEAEAKLIVDQADTEEPTLANEVPSNETVAKNEAPDYTLWGAIGSGIMSLLLMIAAVLYLRKRKKSADQAEQESEEKVITDDVMNSLKESPMPEDETDILDDDELTEMSDSDTALERVQDKSEIIEPEPETEPEPEPEPEPVIVPEQTTDEQPDETVDLSGELEGVVEELEAVTEENLEEASIETSVDEDEEDVAASIAQAIEDAADEQEDALDQEIEDALDISDSIFDDDDEEFNLEDFDIGDTDDLNSDAGSDEDKQK